MLWHLLTSSLLIFFCLKAYSLFFFFWPLLQNAQTKIAIVYMREQTSDTRYDSNICTTMIWYVFYGKYGSLMCTRNVAGNTQMASLDRQVTQNGLGVSNAMERGIYNGGIPRYQDDMEVTVEGLLFVRDRRMMVKWSKLMTTSRQ